MNLSKNAKREGLSLNQYIRKTLETNLTLESLEREIKDIKKEFGNRENEK